MISVGIRASSSYVVFAIYDAKNKKIINIEKINKPQILSNPEQLSSLRLFLKDIISEYNVSFAGMKGIEYSVYKPNRERIENETIIQEVFESSGLKSYFVGVNANLTKILKIEKDQLKPILDNKKDFKVINGLNQIKNKEEREAVIVAFAASEENHE